MNESQSGFIPLMSTPTSATALLDLYAHPLEPLVGNSNGPTLLIHGADAEPERAAYFLVKSWIDRLITSVLTVLAMPVMAAVALAVLLCDGRPVFYRQVRVGRHGREFRIWKFRTMRRDAEIATGAVWSSKSDARVTPLGRWLRCSHLDELPQFFNVLAGDMNLVGPRPERPEFARELERQVPDYGKRTAVRPGITGLAQLRLGYDRSVADVRKKLRLDLQYIRTATFSQDVWLLACTLPYITQQLTRKWSSSPPSGTSVTTDASGERQRKSAPDIRCVQSRDLATSGSTHRTQRAAMNGRDAHAANERLVTALKILAPLDHVEDECA